MTFNVSASGSSCCDRNVSLVGRRIYLTQSEMSVSFTRLFVFCFKVPRGKVAENDLQKQETHVVGVCIVDNCVFFAGESPLFHVREVRKHYYYSLLYRRNTLTYKNFV
jgi:hypothetical protein